MLQVSGLDEMAPEASNLLLSFLRFSPSFFFGRVCVEVVEVSVRNSYPWQFHDKEKSLRWHKWQRNWEVRFKQDIRNMVANFYKGPFLHSF